MARERPNAGWVVVAIALFGRGAVGCGDEPSPGDFRVLSVEGKPVEGGCGYRTASLWIDQAIEVKGELWSCTDGKESHDGCSSCDQYGWVARSDFHPSRTVLSANCTTEGCSASIASNALIEVTSTRAGDAWVDILVRADDHDPPVLLRGHVSVSLTDCP